MASNISIPHRLPLLVVSGGILLPGASMRIPVNTPRNMNMVKSRILRHNTLSSTIIGVVPKDPELMKDDLSSLHPIGTAAVVVQVTGTNWPKPAYSLLVTGLCRFGLDSIVQESPYPVAVVNQLDKLPGEDVDSDSAELGDVADVFREQANALIELLDVTMPVVRKLKRLLDSLPVTRLPDIFTAIIKASYNEKIKVLDAVDIEARFRETLPLLMRQIEGLKLLQQAKKGKQGKLDTEDHKKNIRVMDFKKELRKYQKSINDEGEVDEISELEEKIKSASLPEHALKAAKKELKRLKKMPTALPEYAITRNYLELMLELPWSKNSRDVLDISKARHDLDQDHYGLEKLKKRVIEYLAVRQLKNTLKGPILCFIGPPGVGKTSVGRSIAQTLGRTFHRISLGGCCDQSDIRGHRRTYIGSMPGRIIHGLKVVGTNNPVFLLDEIDKLGKSLQGDPGSALLEVLDPEQNNSFTDHYLNVPFDLSQVLFIATANSVSTIPAPLLDRMEVIHVPGYTQEEKIKIAMHHLISKQLKEHGLTAEQIQIPEDTVKQTISQYTREAGVRQLDRKLGAICRAVAVKVAETRSKTSQEGTENKDLLQIKNETQENVNGSDVLEMSHPPDMPIVIDEFALKDILGPPIYESEMSERLSQPGVAVGLAWTAMGGEIMFVEATRMDGEGRLTLTGQLGDVMKESASLALNWVRSHAVQCGIETKPGTDLMENTDIHIHFPAGAVGKDGPSAGVTIVTVLVSIFTGRCVRSDTAMTGELTLRGLVLPVGGIKEKVLAAHRAGIKRVIIPKRNEKDLIEVPQNIQKNMQFSFAKRLEDVLQDAFEGGFPSMQDATAAVTTNSKL
ncbi:lon protease homolog 2, peroxisomal-like [Anneissia japonica]|uniref:lon protease homolog 2, peroxisomal-like n=1 Tax=Anneissia japonica TaxID=1529436 RepID=UPI0014257790|nr:lon protease homolog 2, peroxisomal-like [Anneissia japonica]